VQVGLPPVAVAALSDNSGGHLNSPSAFAAAEAAAGLAAVVEVDKLDLLVHSSTVDEDHQGHTAVEPACAYSVMAVGFEAGCCTRALQDQSAGQRCH